MTVAIGLSTTAYSSGITRMTDEFGVANVVGQLGLTTFNCACAIAPLFLAPFCELVGRREVFLSAYFGFTVIFILIADAPNIGAVLAGRLLSGIFGSCGTILVGTSSPWPPARGTMLIRGSRPSQAELWPTSVSPFPALFALPARPCIFPHHNGKVGGPRVVLEPGWSDLVGRSIFWTQLELILSTPT